MTPPTADKKGMRRHGVREDQRGFTLIELLVVILIIAILAALAIPIYLKQREKAWNAQVQSALKNASTAIESRAVTFVGDFSSLDEQDGSALAVEGFKMPDWAQAPGYLRIEATSSEYCIEAQHASLSPTAIWRRSTYESSVGQPQSTPDVCPEL